MPVVTNRSSLNQGTLNNVSGLAFTLAGVIDMSGSTARQKLGATAVPA